MADSPVTPREAGDRTAPHVTPVTPAEDVRTVYINSVSIGAVIAGILVALAVHLVIVMIGLGLGLSTLDPGTTDNPDAGTFSIMAGIWWVVSGIIASYVGGLTAGRLSGRPKESTGGWHGLAAWAGTLIVIAWMVASGAGALVGGVLNTLGTATQVAATAVGGAADPLGDIADRIGAATAGTDPAALREAASAAIEAAVNGDPAQAGAARMRAAEALARAQDVPVEQAQMQVADLEAGYRQAVDRAQQIADDAADAASAAAIFAAIALLLGGVAAWFGGRVGAVDPTITGFVTTRRL